MTSPETFRELLGRVRAGDEQAAAELVRQYEPAIRRAARVRMRDARLGRMFDSMDICQSVLASFFVRAASGVYDLETPDQLLRLLATMARNKLANQAHHLRAARRDHRRVEGGDVALEVAGRDPGVSGQFAARELLGEVQRRLTAEECAILELREQGSDWSEVAVALGGTAEALRKRFTRGIDRVARQLGLDGTDHE
jgi:DNA-directed RNA polymerase specialized sigma24 family protein